MRCCEPARNGFRQAVTAMTLLNTGAMSAGVSDMEDFLPFLTDGGLRPA
ncbi:hypothetical protein NT01EI_2693 [Edwardsiella ictaluri 93-146]|uniref:Uncharacterized protein n=1 Tax=Edwardsiella ictaluri (strain 93-146) TaxID=634503 RepID=C5B8K0_EDWI9|nr:hypothetical protein NT01EI_2693 [Edwardsiella ictaluri 93-146]